MVWPWQRNRDPRGRGADPRVAKGSSGIGSLPEPSPFTDPSFTAGLRAIPSGAPELSGRGPALDITGLTPSGTTIDICVGDRLGRVLLAFLTTDCDGCQAFWDGLRGRETLGLPADVSIVAVTRGPGSLPAADVAISAHGLAPESVVMSDQAWIDYGVTGYPFFVLIDATTRSVVGETVGFGWTDVIGMTRNGG
jgi:hypothetical protein